MYEFDVQFAFMNGDLKEEVYVGQPEGFVSCDENKIYWLKKVLYGPKQAPRAWYKKVDFYFKENGFESKNKATLYMKKKSDVDFLVVCLYVDDMIFMGSYCSI